MIARPTESAASERIRRIGASSLSRPAPAWPALLLPWNGGSATEPACPWPILPRLLAAASDDGAVAVDPVGHRQYLLGVYRRSALEGALARLRRPDGRSVRELVDGFRVHEVSGESAAGDLDTWSDAARFGARPLGPR